MIERENRTGVEELASLLKNLPLETCHYECDVVTKEWGWRAPKDKVFRISGHFVIYTDQSTNEMSLYCPQDSADIIKEEHPKEYQRLLKRAKGDEDTALKFFVENHRNGYFYENIPPKFFDGKWLSIEKSDGVKIPNFIVKKDIEARYDPTAYLRAIEDITPESKIITECRFIWPTDEIWWTQEYVEPVLGKCKIELIDSPDEKKNLYIPKTPDKKHLCSTDSKKLDYDVIVSTRIRPAKRQEKELKDFTESNKDWAFTDPDSRVIIHDDFSIAYRKKKEIIIPGKRRISTK